MSNFNFDRDLYIRIMNSEGISQALTILHKDLTRWEYQSFEGPKGYQPQMWDALKEVRDFSRELWEIALRKS